MPRAAPADGGFDFQKFLDQMKTKSAEPVSKYLRSYVLIFVECLAEWWGSDIARTVLIFVSPAAS